MFDIYVDQDIWGLEEETWVKDGGYEGDTVYFFLDYNPMDYYLMVAHTTCIFEEVPGPEDGYTKLGLIMFFNRTELAPSWTTLCK
jgi:hypothetical protein